MLELIYFYFHFPASSHPSSPSHWMSVWLRLSLTCFCLELSFYTGAVPVIGTIPDKNIISDTNKLTSTALVLFQLSDGKIRKSGDSNKLKMRCVMWQQPRVLHEPRNCAGKERMREMSGKMVFTVCPPHLLPASPLRCTTFRSVQICCQLLLQYIIDLSATTEREERREQNYKQLSSELSRGDCLQFSVSY